MSYVNAAHIAREEACDGPPNNNATVSPSDNATLTPQVFAKV